MSYAATITQRNHSINRNKIIVVLLILFIILFGVLYIIQANSVATGGYKIQKHKNEISKLQSENQVFELRLFEMRSLDFLEQRIGDLNMVKTGRVEYLSPVSQVAAR